MALSADTPRTYELGDVNTLPVKASTKIYEGAAVGDDASGYARGLVANDPFRGFAQRQADNSGSAVDGAINVTVKAKGEIVLAVTSLAITDVGKNVYASADDTFVLTAASGTRIGRVKRYTSSGVGVVEFDATANDGVQPERIYGALAVNGGVTLADATDIAIATTTGTKIGTAATAKVGFFGKAPAAQQAVITVSTTDTSATNVSPAVASIIAALKTFGFIATA